MFSLDEGYLSQRLIAAYSCMIIALSIAFISLTLPNFCTFSTD